MAQTKSRSKRLFLEQLEDRLTLSVVNPAIEFVNGTNGPNSTAPNTLEVMNADGSNQTALVSMAGLRTPRWSPNLLGNSASVTAYEGALAFNTFYNTATGSRISQIWLTTVTAANGTPQGSTPFLLEDLSDPNAQNYGGTFPSTWSPNENPTGGLYTGWIAFGAGGSINVTLVQFNGTTVTGPYDQSTVLWNSVPITGGQIGWPAWSNDGNWIAFSEQRYNGSAWEGSLWMVKVTVSSTGVTSTGPAINVIPEGSFAWITDMEWSRSGSTIAFRGSQNGSQGIPGNLYTVDVSSLETNPPGPPPSFKQVLAAYSSTSPSWSPDITSLVFSGQDLVHHSLTYASIRQVQLSTGQQTILASASTNLAWPNWRATSLPYQPTTTTSATASSLAPAAAVLAPSAAAFVVPALAGIPPKGGTTNPATLILFPQTAPTSAGTSVGTEHPPAGPGNAVNPASANSALDGTFSHANTLASALPSAVAHLRAAALAQQISDSLFGAVAGDQLWAWDS